MYCLKMLLSVKVAGDTLKAHHIAHRQHSKQRLAFAVKRRCSCRCRVGNIGIYSNGCRTHVTPVMLYVAS
jgi:hypothetical protein